jgi:hypothetical protein
VTLSASTLPEPSYVVGSDAVPRPADFSTGQHVADVVADAFGPQGSPEVDSNDQIVLTPGLFRVALYRLGSIASRPGLFTLVVGKRRVALKPSVAVIPRAQYSVFHGSDDEPVGALVGVASFETAVVQNVGDRVGDTFLGFGRRRLAEFSTRVVEKPWILHLDHGSKPRFSHHVAPILRGRPPRLPFALAARRFARSTSSPMLFSHFNHRATRAARSMEITPMGGSILADIRRVNARIAEHVP